MPTLAAQLAQNASLNASLLVDRSRQKPTASYLFTGKDADELDLESIYALGVNSLLSLSSVEPKLRKFEDDLFSEQAKETDRTLLTKERIAELDERIEEFLWVLGPHLMEPPTAKILEWLVRRFRIHEFNVQQVVSLFLPYHESPHFAKMITILQIKPNTLWGFLLPYKSAAQKLPRVSLVTEMLKDSDLARFVSSLLPTSMKKGFVHRTIIAFNAATMHDFIKRSKSINEGTLAHILPALLEPLHQTQKKTVKDAVLGSYILLASLSQKCKFSPAALQVVVGEIVSAFHLVRPDQLVQTLVAVCGPQDVLEKLPSEVVKDILGIPDIQKTLLAAAAWVGSEKIFHPLVRGLVSKLRKDEIQAFLENIIATPALPPTIMDSLTSELIKIAIKSEDETDKKAIADRLLSLIHQRYPRALRSAAELLSVENESLKEVLDQLVITLSTVRISSSSEPNRSEKVDFIISSSDADADVRTMAVKELVKSVDGKRPDDIEDFETIRNVLVSRLQDTTASVLEALYANPAVVTPIFCEDPKSFVASLALAFASQEKPKRSFIKLHLLYLISHFWPATSTPMRDEIFHRILFPFLLFTKSRQKTAELVWELIKDRHPKATESSGLSWIDGCDALAKTELAKTEQTDAVELMNQINFSISSKIAENIISSNNVAANVEAVAIKMRDVNSHVRLFGYLIALELIKKSSGHQQVGIGEKIQFCLGVDELAGVDDLSQEHLSLEKSDGTSFGKYIVTKPNNNSTLSWMRIAVVAAIARIPCPTGVILNWLLESPKCETEGQRYVRLMRAVYHLANSSTSLPTVSSTILQLLFLSLKDQSLAFLAGVWTCSNQEFKDLKAVSLLHAAAFLEAHLLEDDGLDFQTILPSIFVALHDSDSQLSQVAFECISRIWILAERPCQSVYQFDAIYGRSDETLQYLDPEDLKRYLTGLVEHRDHLCSDPSYLSIFHEEHLGKVTAEKRKDVDYKHRVICFLLSHANAFPSDFGKAALLRSIATVPNKTGIQILLPSIKTLVEKAASISATDLFLTISEELTIRLLALYDLEAAGTLNNNPDSWEVFSKVVRTFLRPGILLAIQKAVAHVLSSGLFGALNQRRQLALCSLLLDIGSSDPSTQSLARGSLSNALNDVTLIVELLDQLAPSVEANSPRAAKRPKTSEISEEFLPHLALLAEVLGTKSLPGSLELTTHLLETLNKVVQSLPAAQADVVYVHQLLMSAIESTSSKIKEVPNISPSVIRIDVLVEVIRTSRNPQTFHQALLLIANLARLAPDSVLFNVMPVFTFMGSNVFHRDDSYSFKVVQETVDGIIPVMVSSLRESHSQPLDLYLAAKELLRVFTDAAAHIPRHRRNSFFSHLVDVFGRRDFLPPIFMLLLEKTANRVVRQPPEELQNTLSLPITLFQQSGYDIQIHTATELLNEAQRLLVHINDPNSIQPTFMEAMLDGEHTASPSTVLKRRAQALIVFVGLAFKPNKPGKEGQSPISPLVAQLMALATVDTNYSAKLDDILEAARSSLNRLLSTMSVFDFIESVQSILLSEDVKIQSGAFDVLAMRLPEISARVRPNIKDNIKQILQLTKNFLHVNTSGDAPAFAFQALKAIADTLCTGEEGSLADVVPYVLTATNDKDLVSSSLSALTSISVKLGPRIIPFFRQIIAQCVSILRGHDSALFGNAVSTLQGLLKTIPAFWGSGELSQIVFLFIDQQSSASNANASGISTLTKSLAKKIPPNVLIPALMEMWDPLQGSKNLSRVSAFFSVFGRALQHADRPTVLEYIRDIFKLFLEALDVVKAHEEAESRVIHAFREIVVKLTESAFKPLFRRLHDWAFVGAIDPERQTTFCHLYIHLLDFFKGLMVPYVSYLLQPLSNALDSFKSNDYDIALWSSVINVLTRTFSHDENGFWRDDKLRQLLTGLTNQVEVSSRSDSVEKKELQDCFVALLDVITDDTLVKAVNLNILMHTRSENLQIRIFALSCSEVIWRSHGGRLLGFVAETATFIGECGEDENDLVIIAASKLKDAVEAVAGKIDGL